MGESRLRDGEDETSIESVIVEFKILVCIVLSECFVGERKAFEKHLFADSFLGGEVVDFEYN